MFVGFSSLGVTRRKWPPPDGGFANLLIIPMLGIDQRFHGQPPERESRYSYQILRHLLYEAGALLKSHLDAGRNTLTLLALYVHQDNHRAIRLYTKFGFSAEPAAARDNLLLMIRRL